MHILFAILPLLCNLFSSNLPSLQWMNKENWLRTDTSLSSTTPTTATPSTSPSQNTANDGAVLIRLGGEVLHPSTASEPPLDTSTPISIDVVQMKIQDIVRIFAQHSGQNILLAEGVNGTITARLQHVPWQTALQSIVYSNGWTLVAIGEIWMITPQQPSTPSRSN